MSELLPEPLTPVTVMNVPNGKCTSMLRRLCCRAPITDKTCDEGQGSGISPFAVCCTIVFTRCFYPRRGLDSIAQGRASRTLGQRFRVETNPERVVLHGHSPKEYNPFRVGFTRDSTPRVREARPWAAESNRFAVETHCFAVVDWSELE